VLTIRKTERIHPKRFSKCPQNWILDYAGAEGEVSFCQAAFPPHGKAVAIGLKSPCPPESYPQDGGFLWASFGQVNQSRRLRRSIALRGGG
jgi:hypothetical protein